MVSPALATIGAGNGEMGFDFGVTDFDPDTTGHTGVRLALRGGYHFSRYFELEALVGTSIYYESSGFSFPNFDDLHRVFDLSYYFLNGVFNFRPRNSKIVPYLYAGLGSAEFDLARDVVDDSSAIDYGGGCRFFFGEAERSAFRIELSAIDADNFEVSATHPSLTLGFTWRLGGAR